MNRKEFIKNSLYLGAGLSFIGCLNDKTETGEQESNWKDGDVAHILPTVNHNRMLVSTSFKRVLQSPILKIGNQSIKGEYAAKHKKPIMLSGDLHAFGAGQVYRNGTVDMSDNPINCYLTGPLGCTVFPSTNKSRNTSCN